MIGGAGEPGSLPSRLPLPVYLLSHVYPHHAAKSGYHRLAEFAGTEIAPATWARALGDTLFRVPAKLVATYGGVFEYSRYSFTAELDLSLRLLRSQAIYHFLYAEKGFLFSWRFRRRNRLIGTFHHHPSSYPAMMRRTSHLRHLDHAVVLSSTQAEPMERLVGPGRVSVVPYGVDTDYWSPAGRNAEAGLAERCIFVGFHMRDFATLNEVVGLVLDRRPHAEFLLISRVDDCAAIARRRRVTWIRRAPDEEYRELLRSSAVMVLPLEHSAAVTAVMEGMACGLPIVTNHGGISDYLVPTFAVERPVGDAAGMANAVCDLLENERLRRSMATSAREHALGFAWPRVAESLRSLYSALS